MYIWNQKFLEQIQLELPKVWEEAVQTRRYLHMHPELGYETPATEAFVRKRLTEFQISMPPAKMGVFGLIPGKDHEHIVALRADMDALPIEEENDVPYRSQYPGKMHACGHDGHTAMLLGAAKLLKKHQEMLPMDVLLIFQPAEEGPTPGGAFYMLEDLREQGIADKIVRIFGMHLFNDFPTGQVCIKYGAMASSTDDFEITILGRGGHAGQPDKCVDALSIGAKVVTALESFMSRRINPFDQAILSIGTFQAGTVRNVVAETARMSGTIRCQREATRTLITENMVQIVKGICTAFGADCNVDICHGLPVLMNEKDAVDYSAAAIEHAVGKDHLLVLDNPMMGAEDFTYFAEAFPASFIWIGSGNAKKGLARQNHQPRFDFDEDALMTGILLHCVLAANMAL